MADTGINQPFGLRMMAARQWMSGIGALGLTGLFGALILIVFVLATFLVPLINAADPDAMSMNILQPPGFAHPFGTDHLGRDMFLQFVYGIRVSVFVGIAVAFVASVAGVLIGGYAGFAGGIPDLIVMRVTELFQVIPSFVLAAVIVAMWGAGLMPIVFVISALSWPQIAIVVRSEVIRIKNLDFVDGVRCQGYGEAYILAFEIIPNALRPVMALATLAVGQAIMMEASLSFLGLGDPTLISWGKMLNVGQGYLTSAWWLAVFPGLAIFLTILACNLLGDGLNGLLNPKDKGGR